MSFSLDTDTISTHLRRAHALTSRFVQYGGRLYLSTISLGELFAWAYKRDTVKRLRIVDEFLPQLVRLAFDDACAEEFGKLRGLLLRQGISVPTADLMIAATARVHDLTLVTHNTADFARVPDLRLEDWLAS
ncbi:MAG: type II toxin-antitoxin system VapC family toxin [Pirellulales bacterium]